MYCKDINTPSAKTPSANATSLLSNTEASVEPSATVTIKSNSFIWDKVLFPEILSITIREKYASSPIKKVLQILSQLLKNIFSIVMNFQEFVDHQY